MKFAVTSFGGAWLGAHSHCFAPATVEGLERDRISVLFLVIFPYEIQFIKRQRHTHSKNSTNDILDNELRRIHLVPVFRQHCYVPSLNLDLCPSRERVLLVQIRPRNST